jgi:hypothetical protein
MAARLAASEEGLSSVSNHGLGVYSASNRNEYQESSRGKGRPALKVVITLPSSVN